MLIEADSVRPRAVVLLGGHEPGGAWQRAFARRLEDHSAARVIFTDRAPVSRPLRAVSAEAFVQEVQEALLVVGWIGSVGRGADNQIDPDMLWLASAIAGSPSSVIVGMDPSGVSEAYHAVQALAMAAGLTIYRSLSQLSVEALSQINRRFRAR